jgi:predicted nucleotidyltransferase component of viral defense system
VLGERQAIEVFHLLFLRAFGARVDKALFALKGGCNLRFFHKSIRYSEDMDLDIRAMSVGTLRNNVDRVLNAPAFAQTLRTQQIEINQVTSSKQTETTQRWKLGLLVGGITTLPTKIEFSRRALDEGLNVAPVDPVLIRNYRLYPVLVQHYNASTAFWQKVLALALRSQTQARDVFDLKHLLDSAGAPGEPPPSVRAKLARAIDNAMSIDYDAFAGQVVAYLEPDYHDHYRRRQTWESLQEEVVNALQALRS